MKIVESPREGLQSLPYTVPTDQKVSLMNRLLGVGYDTVETGSMAHPKYIPQLADTLEVLDRIDPGAKRSKVMVLALNRRGAEKAAVHPSVDCISYPYSISPAFAKKNLNRSMEESFRDVQEIKEICLKNGKEPVIYISMAFGNPYNDDWSINLLLDQLGQLDQLEISSIPLSNVSIPVTATLVSSVFTAIHQFFPDIEAGLHLHTTTQACGDILDAAYDQGCRWFDTVMNGIGGCPMSGTELMGNLDPQTLISHFNQRDVPVPIRPDQFSEARQLAGSVFAGQTI